MANTKEFIWELQKLKKDQLIEIIVYKTVQENQQISEELRGFLERRKQDPKPTVSEHNLAAVFAHNLAKTPIPANVDVSSLFLLLIAGSRVSPEVILALRKMLHPLATIIQGYAQTEFCGTNTFYDTNDKDHRKLFTEKPHSVGLPGKGYIYKVVDLETNEILGPNKQGELLVKAPTVMNGYYKGDSKDAFDEDGFYKTGDIAYYDEDQCFYIVDRIKGVIRYLFHMLSSAEIEEILTNHPAVRKAAVFGYPHPVDLHHVTALVEVDETSEVTPEEIREYVDNQVPDHKRLRGGVKFVKSIPMTTTGKVKCGELKSFMEKM
ncbi:unnamed protein product [Brassicogethes aeneus]|uniref:Luciferin 4-monooxygenase n=1 Tax=Brassicogethes aeneus TaxID=1431903 RepID=A0A9P0FBZ3_BRAAE|nr:unnamed protein product [Brassicogethes aeneus]